MATMTRKAVRGLNIDYRHTFSDGREMVRVTVIDGSKRDGYQVTRERDSLSIRWQHVAGVERDYRVTCTIDGQAIACECEGFAKWGKVCKHMKGTAGLLADGELDNGPEQDGYPEGWGWDEERAEAESAYYAAMRIGPKVHAYRD